MNIRATAVRILCAGLFADLPAGGQPPADQHLKFSSETQLAGDRAQAFTVTILSARDRRTLGPGQRPWMAARALLPRELKREMAR
jgi:hypothetical protein